MTKKKVFLLSILLISLSLSACVKAATTIDATPTQDEISSIFTMAQTLTAQAPSAGEGTEVGEVTQDNFDPFAATATSTPPVVTATPTQGATAAPTQPQTVPTTHTLQKREYPYCIARRFDVDIDALMSTNGLTSSSLYEEGLVLTIPQDTGPFIGERMLIPHPTQYTVQAGDTIYWIACRFGDVFPKAIAQANGFGLEAVLTVGQVIQIP
jgi:LysM repeat protein